jgi:hypothetical protein
MPVPPMAIWSTGSWARFAPSVYRNPEEGVFEASVWREDEPWACSIIFSCASEQNSRAGQGKATNHRGPRAGQRRSSPDYLPALKKELLEVVRKYVPIDQSQIKVHLDREGGYEILELNITLPDEAIQAANVPHIGHTEMLAALTGTHDPLTMFETLGLRVFFLSRHVSLRQSCDLVTKARLLDYIERCHQAMEQLGLGGGELAVAGLNPHSGEHGLFGDEEVREVEPAVLEARKRGFRVVGPIGADSVFHQAKIGRYAAVLSLYHDQGHIATKTLDFERTISLTLGLPFLRTSVDHGTAFDIAWQGKASAISMIESILVAARYTPAYRRSVAR